MSLRHRLPRVITLPASSVMPVATLSICLGQPSRSLRSTWVRRKGFPAAWKDGSNWYIDVAAVERFLKSRGCNVVRYTDD